MFLRGLLTRIRYFKGNLTPGTKKRPPGPTLRSDSKTINMMAEKIEAMKTTIDKTSPRSFSLLFILSSLPTFFLVKELLETEYNEEQFYGRIRQILDYYYFKNTFFLSSAVLMSAFGFITPSALYTVSAVNSRYLFLPLVATAVGLCLPKDLLSKWVVLPALVTDVSSMTVAAFMTNEGVLPFWFYNYRHYLHMLDLAVLVICYYAIKRLQVRMDTKPHEFQIVEA